MHQNSHQNRKIFIFFLLVAWICVAFYGFKQTDLGNSSEKLTTIKIGYLSGDEIEISAARGALKKKLRAKGYNVVFKKFTSGAAETEALASGSIDYARTGDTPPVAAIAAGSKITYIATGGVKSNGTGILVKKSSGITKVSQLRGKKIAYTKSTASEYFVRALLKKYGLSTSDVKLVNLETNAASVAYSKGKVDAIVAWDPTTAQLQLSGSTLLADGNDVNYNNRSYILSSSTFAKNHKSLSKLLIKYLSQDMKWANSHHSTLIKLLSEKLGVKKSVIKTTINRRKYDFEPVTQTAIKESQAIADTFYKAGVIKKDPKIKSHVQYLSVN
ncbi:aliphatic sulfonate ABC transporter substrate-binding protein [Lactobacillus corticis]|uniref:Nitrate/sulfonate/bicarbonate ABC transporter substrate-binding component n=1 Tax=Lactobacillus corticis TaxID=2201249 RepID=A0A916QIY1_9LACO|nr:aliphatic sulfonate ABC transporter substrate-binding protein [Lactobacillus corticis]GFZ27022.1 nitrate/sulfonate/bicarbonate ABC transporter substrate-binding component [Lactobacillus corticis]